MAFPPDPRPLPRIGGVSQGCLGDLAPSERYQLVDDTWATVLAGSTEASTFIDLARSFADETDLAVWGCILTGLSDRKSTRLNSSHT